MSNASGWREFWEKKARAASSDFEVDRLNRPQDEEVENRAEQELLRFIGPNDQETVLDAGCGTGVNIVRLHGKVARIFGMDYAAASVQRCRRKLQEYGIHNAHIQVASVTAVPLASQSVDKVLCLSVLHYLDDEEVERALREFARVLRPGGEMILHVKNLSSLYWTSLRLAKKMKALFRKRGLSEHVRSFGWYEKKLESLGFSVVECDSFNLLVIDMAPQWATSRIRRFEVMNHGSGFFRGTLARKHGAELMMKARHR
jgi:SAM-dependent methyltransferase